VHPRWHRITGDVYSVVAGGQYLAITNNEGQVSLLNKKTKVRQPLTPTNCSGAGAVGFGGGWFAVSCAVEGDTDQLMVDLYDLSTGTWTQQPIAPTICDETGCTINSIGTTWIRFFAVGPDYCSSHCTYTGYLQNIATGAVKEDPVDSSMASLNDDLDTPSGIGKPCTTSQPGAYSQIYGPPLTFSDAASFWQPAGGFVLVTGYPSFEGPGTPDYLYKCGATTKLRLPQSTYASADAVIYQHIEGSAAPLIGRYLPTLRSFTIPKPMGGLVALSKTTVYTDQRTVLWAGTFARP
jgi:hypothetical protein